MTKPYETTQEVKMALLRGGLNFWQEFKIILAQKRGWCWLFKY